MKYLLKLFLLVLPFSVNAIELDQAIKDTIKNNLKIKSAKYKFLVEKEQYNQASSLFLPAISGSLSYTLGDTELSLASKNISISQQIFAFGGNLSAYKKAKKLTLAAEINFLQKKQQVIFEMVKAYTNVLEKKEAKKLHEHNVRTIEKQLDAARKRFELGETTKIDLEKSKSRLSSAISERIRAEGELNNAYANYVHIARDSPEELAEPKSLPKIPGSLKKAIELAFLNNLQINSAKLIKESAEYGLNEAKSKLLPSLSASLSIQQIQGSNAWNTMLTASIPLFQRGADYLKLTQAKYSLYQSRENYNETKLAVEEAITVAWNGLITTKSVLKSSQKEVRSMSIVVDSQKEAKKLNLSTIINVIDAENDLLKAKKQHLSAKIQYIVAIYNLMLLTSDVKMLFE
ncbi:MAG: TolC family protein [Rickettsiaceae bacterium H1]|nr:TolC family protein [Rickettsiaceae bacterium H1]